MKFEESTLDGVWIIEPKRQEDERGFFARTWCAEEFSEQGLAVDLTQCSLSYSWRERTLRGLHYQVAPAQEAKLVRCTMGAIYDVAVDLRPESPTYLRWFALELSAANRKMLYLPHGCAHGLLTLHDNTEVFYQMSGSFAPECARGVRWNDPVFDIDWPAEPVVITERDRDYPDYIPVPTAPREVVG